VTQDIPKRLQGALLRIRGDHPFFGALALFAEFRVTADVATAATDGKVLWFNPVFVEEQDQPQLCGLVAHELCTRRFNTFSGDVSAMPRCGTLRPTLSSTA
jgi:predicted metal-dependent peptidase